MKILCRNCGQEIKAYPVVTRVVWLHVKSPAGCEKAKPPVPRTK